MLVLDTFYRRSYDATYSAVTAVNVYEFRAVICQKLISVESNGHCCHRPSSKLGNQTKLTFNRTLFSIGQFDVNLQATKLFIVTSATKGGGTTPLRFRVRFKILYRVIQRLIQHCLVHKMVYLNIIYVIATRNYEFSTTGIFP